MITIPKEKWCIYEKCSQTRTAKYCHNAEHLKSCTDDICKKHFKCPNSYCIPYSYLCDGAWDCPQGQDEKQDVCFSCVGAYRCRNQIQCVPISIICDGDIQCPSGDDELPCIYNNITCPSTCICMLYSLICINTESSSIVLLSDEYQNNLYFLFINESKFLFHSMIFLHLSNLLYLNISRSNISYICFGKSVFLSL